MLNTDGPRWEAGLWSWCTHSQHMDPSFSSAETGAGVHACNVWIPRSVLQRLFSQSTKDVIETRQGRVELWS